MLYSLSEQSRHFTPLRKETDVVSVLVLLILSYFLFSVVSQVSNEENSLSKQ